MRSTFVACGPHRLHVLDSGESGLPVLCFHGNSSSSEAFSDLQTADAGCRLICVDLPGHGRSSRATEPRQTYTFAGFAAAIRAVIEHFAFGDYAVIGHSLGGHAAIEALPELPRPRALVLIAAPPFNRETAALTFPSDPSEGLVFRARLRSREVTRLAAAFVGPAGVSPTQRARIEERIRRTDPLVRAELGDSLRQGAHADERALLRASRVPALLVLGRADGFIDWRRCRAADFAGCRPDVAVFEDCGHSPHLEQPDRLRNLVYHFINRSRKGET